MAWYNNSWKYREKITIDHTKVPNADQTSFPVFLNLGDFDANFWANVQSGGGDIRITKSDATTEVAREVVFCDTTNKIGEVHFQADTLSHTTDSIFYIYYGNSGASDYATNATFGAQNVWDTNFVAVWHFGDGTNTNFNDSTSNANNGTNHSSTEVTGKVGGAINVNGSSQYVQVANATSLQLTGDYTFSFWDNPSSTQAVNTDIMRKNGAGGVSGYGAGEQGNANSNVFTTGFENSGGVNGWGVTSYTLTAGTWKKADIVHSGTSLTPYVNTVAGTGATVAANVGTDTAALFIGTWSPGSNDHNGKIDEMRISKVARSTNWLTTEYNNQNSSSTFYTIAAQEANSVPSNETPPFGSGVPGVSIGIKIIVEGY